MSNQTKFALTPGLTSDQPIDYSTTWGLEQWTESTKKLSDTKKCNYCDKVRHRENECRKKNENKMDRMDSMTKQT